MEITIDALSAAFGELFLETVVPDPDRLSFWLDNRERIERPIYVCRMIGAMGSRFETGDLSSLGWCLELCDWVLSHADRERQPGPRPSDQSRDDPHWGEYRRAVGDLLGNLVTVGSEGGVLATDIFSDELLGLLSRLCTEYDWSLDTGQQVFLGRNDWMNEAINHTRGRALRDLLRCGRWLRKENPDADVSAITNALEARIGPAAKFSLSLPENAILGLGYPDALSMDEEWGLAHKSDFFPQHDTGCWLVSFGVFLRHYGPHQRLFEVLEDDFRFAVETLVEQSKHDTSLATVLDTLGQRLVVYAVSGTFPLRGEGSLLERYYDATTERRQHWADLFANVGRILGRADRKMEETVRQGYEAFVEWRLEVGDPAELESFDPWLEASCLGVEWRLNAYSRALDVCRFDGGSFRHHWVPISKLVPEHTRGVVECFAKLADRLPRDRYLPAEPIKRMLKAGLASKDDQVRQDTAHVLETLLTNGQFDVTILDE